MEKTLHIIDRISYWSGVIAACLFPVLVLIMVYEVVARYIFHSPTTWAFEMSIFVCSGACMVGGAYCLLYNAHIRVDIFWNRFSERGRAIADLATSAVFYLLVAVLVWYGWRAFYDAILPPLEHTMTPWRPMLWPFRLTVPVASFLLLLQLVVKSIRDFRLAVTGKTEVN